MNKEFNLNIDLFVATFLILFAAKIFGFIAISWWWVFLPLLIPAIFFVLALVIIIVIMIADVVLNR